MKTLILVAAFVAVAYCQIDNIWEMDVTTSEERVIVVERKEKDKVILKCPVADQDLCTWYHEDWRIPKVYGEGAMVNTKGSLYFQRVELKHSGTYTVECDRRRVVYHLIVRPDRWTDLRDDLREHLEEADRRDRMRERPERQANQPDNRPEVPERPNIPKRPEEDPRREMREEPLRRELRSKTFERKYLYNTVIRNMRIDNVRFNDIFFHKVEFANINFANVVFRWTDKIPTRVSFIGCNFENVTWENALLEKSQFKKCRWVERDTTRVTFKSFCIRDTIFCENMWTMTRWEEGEVFNTTFVKNHFDRHTFVKTKFLKFHVDKVNCSDIQDGMIPIDWEYTNGQMQCYVHRRDADLKKECEVWEDNERRRCEFYPSVKFWECRMRKVEMRAVELRAVEWRRTSFKENRFYDLTLEESYFIICMWNKNIWLRVTVITFSRFLANKFNGDDLHFRATDFLWFYNCHFSCIKIRWLDTAISRRIHFEKCFGDDVELIGTQRHDIFRWIDTAMTNIRLRDTVIKVLEHCNTMLNDIEMIDTNVLEVRDVCNSNWPIEDCKNTWRRDSLVHDDDRCVNNILLWCKKEVNRRHPVCFAFTRPNHRVCCPKMISWRMNWQWWREWRATDYRCERCEDTRIELVRRDDDREDLEFVVKDCIERMMLEREARNEYNRKNEVVRSNEKMPGRRNRLLITGLRRVGVDDDKFPRWEECDERKRSEARKCCREEPDMERREMCCREEKMWKERCEGEFDYWERWDRFREDIMKANFCVRNERE